MDPSKTLSTPLMREQDLRLSERFLLSALSGLPGGKISITLPGGRKVPVGQGNQETATLDLLDAKVPRRLLLGGGMALAETYMEGGWRTDDLSRLLRIFARSQSAMGRLSRGASKMLQAVDHAGHRLRKNTKRNAKANIQAHYDLSNALYETFLDPTLTYSAGIFTPEDADLQRAQLRKIDRLIDSLGLEARHHVLEIGSGWGACAIRMAQRSGCRVTSLTLSEEQAAEARRRVAAAGLTDRVEIRLQDYRDVEGVFDHVISIEMIEAVGHEFLSVYFDSVNRHLRPGGRFALQAITIPDARYRDYEKSCDFIRKHIFPGGHLPSPGMLDQLRRTHTDWELAGDYEFGRDYAETLRRWRDAFLENAAEVRRLGFDEVFVRKWHYYFAYCEAGFDTDLIHVRQLIYQKPPL